MSCHSVGDDRCGKSFPPFLCSSLMSEKFSYKRPPPTKAHVSIDALTAKELNALSLQDRERIFEEVNGITCLVEEDDAFVTQCLKGIDDEIDRLHIDKSAYDLAMSMRPQLRHDRSFLLMFLRAECFDTRKAARRIVKHFDSKLQLFGEEMLVKRITYADLDEDDRAALESGSFLILPSKDQTGRGVVFIAPNQNNFQSWQNQFRAEWYLSMACIEGDESIQKKGFVIVSYHVGVEQFHAKALDLFRNIGVIHDAIPYRIGGLHFCYDISNLRSLATFIQNAVSLDHRLRFRAHYGTHVECQYQLIRFGIPQCILPIDSCGIFKINDFLDSLDEMKRLEKMLEPPVEVEPITSSPVVEDFKALKLARNAIGSKDVLLGRGGYRHSHPANAELSKMIDKHREAYQASSRFEKTCISMSIVNMVKNGNGRFMKRRNKKNDEWIQVSDMEARDAISHRLRNQAPQPKVMTRLDVTPVLSFPDAVMTPSSMSRKRAKAL